MGGVRLQGGYQHGGIALGIQCGVHRRNAAQPLQPFSIVQHAGGGQRRAYPALFIPGQCGKFFQRHGNPYHPLLEGNHLPHRLPGNHAGSGSHGAFHHLAGIGSFQHRVPEGLFRFRHIRLRGVQPRVHGPSLRHPEHQFRLFSAFGDGAVRLLDGFQGFRLFRGYIQASLFQPSLRVRQACTVFKFFQLQQGRSLQDDFPCAEEGVHLVHLPGNAGGKHRQVGGLHDAGRGNGKSVRLQMQRLHRSCGRLVLFSGRARDGRVR